MAKSEIKNKIRDCDVLLIVLSRRSIQRDRSLRQHLRWKYAEAMQRSPHVGTIFLFFDDPRYFSPYFINIINSSIDHTKNNKRIYKVINSTNKENHENNQLCGILTELGGLVCSHNQVFKKTYDVFISYKSEDHLYAKVVNDMLSEKGYEVFFSKETLPQLGSDEYHKEIDRAVDRSKNLVVVTTSSEHVNFNWVEYEWRNFLGELLAGRKIGNLITILADNMYISDLPIALRNRETIMFDDVHKIINYINETREN